MSRPIPATQTPPRRRATESHLSKPTRAAVGVIRSERARATCVALAKYRPGREGTDRPRRVDSLAPKPRGLRRNGGVSRYSGNGVAGHAWAGSAEEKLGRCSDSRSACAPGAARLMSASRRAERPPLASSRNGTACRLEPRRATFRRAHRTRGCRVARHTLSVRARTGECSGG